MFQSLLALFSDQIVQIAGTGLAAIISWLVLTLRTKAHIETQQLLIDILHTAATTGAQVAVAGGATTVTPTSIASVVQHIAASIPDTLKAIGVPNPSASAAIANIAKAKLQAALGIGAAA
ncbi:MAG: hypothetical protein ACOH2H_15295 [Cypionkella sp.]